MYAERERVDVETELVGRLKGSSLITYRTLSTNRYDVECQNSNAELLAELARLRAKAMDQLRKEYSLQESELAIPGGPVHEKVVQLAKLQSLYQDACSRVQNASLASLRQLSLE